MSPLAVVRAGLKAPVTRLVFARMSLVHSAAKTASIKAAEHVKPKHTLEYSTQPAYEAARTAPSPSFSAQIAEITDRLAQVKQATGSIQEEVMRLRRNP